VLDTINNIREYKLIINHIGCRSLDSANLIERKLAASLRVKSYNIGALKHSELLAILFNFYIELREAIALDKEVSMAATSPLLLILILIVSNRELRLKYMLEYELEAAVEVRSGDIRVLTKVVAS